MRIIAGTRKGTVLRCGRGPVFRPTAQVVRGSIFDTLGRGVVGAVFVDLFAGSGSVGIEALSRGARRAVFVEQDRRLLRALRTNLQRCKFTREEATVRIGDAVRYLNRALAGGDFFDIIFADAPYAGNLAQTVLKMVEKYERRVCNLLVLEHGRPIYHDGEGILEMIKSRRFGQTRVTFYRCRESTVGLGGRAGRGGREE